MRCISARGAGWLVCSFVMAAAVAVACGSLSAAERGKRVPKFGEYNPEHESVDLFEGMKNGQLDVKLIPKDSTEANVLIKNKSGKPLNVKLPAAFAGVPVLAQRAAGNLGGGNANTNNQNQGMGGGMGGMGMGGMGGMGGGMGMFNVPAEKVGKFKVPCVCLEHGKREPNASIAYEIRPIDTFTSDKSVQELCRMLGEGKLNQRVAQAAAWNLANGLSWEQLAAKRIEHADGSSEMYFHPQEVQAAMSLANQAVVEAKVREREETKPAAASPGQIAATSESLPSARDRDAQDAPRGK